MKNRFSTLDLVAVVNELRNLIVESRVGNIYDVDTKTHLFKLSRSGTKFTLLVESGIRIHTTLFQWPKNPAPSGFSMKLRKHLKNKKILSISQLGGDRVIDFSFGYDSPLHHLIIELYDRGNIILTDESYTIVAIARTRTDQNTDVRFAIGENFPVAEVKPHCGILSVEKLSKLVENAKATDQIRKLINPNVSFGPALVEHALRSCEVSTDVRINAISIDKVIESLTLAEDVFNTIKSQKSNEGYIIEKVEEVLNSDLSSKREVKSYVEFHPFLFKQHSSLPYKTFPSFNNAVDEFFSAIQGQKLENKAIQQEKQVLKKLDNVRKDHENRISALNRVQDESRSIGFIIMSNLELVENALTVIRSALANQISWKDIAELIEEAKSNEDPVAMAIVNLKLELNHFTMQLYDLDAPLDEKSQKPKAYRVDINIAKSAFANAEHYFNNMRAATTKEQKTIEASSRAFKNAEKATKQTLKQINVVAKIQKSRKVYWFEKFVWFISQEGYLVIGGRDQQQNEFIVKKHLRRGDYYVHADCRGASSLVIKNPSGNSIPQKTLSEAATMAVCYSAAWDMRVLEQAWWVHANQVSKTAPSGEYLTSGSFMIRGKKNFLPPAQLVLGFGIVFKLEESSIPRHKSQNSECDLDSLNDSVSQTSISNELEQDIELSEDENSASENEVPDQLSENIAIDSSEVYVPPVIIEDVVISDESDNPHVDSKEKNICDSISETSSRPSTVPMKRGQRAKLKKMKKKYADQDEEERELKMKLLASAGEKKSQNVKPLPTIQKSKKIKKIQPAPVIYHKEDDHCVPTTEELDTNDMKFEELDELTGTPFPEDELLFAVPVCAPYSAMSKFKFKVKLTPGIGRRGKATKTALHMFMQSKVASNHERDLLRALKDIDLSRNLPGKVKVSAPNLYHVSKKK